MTNGPDQDQFASSEANWSGFTLFAIAWQYPGSAGQRLKIQSLKPLFQKDYKLMF